MKGLRICATGRALPRQIVTNDALSRRVDTSDAWIASRTGIRERRFCCGDETAASLAADAARLALERAGADPGQLCACITATVTPDYASPSVSCLVQQRLGLPEELACFDLSAGCTGFIYALQAARGLLLQDARPYALVIGAEQLSRITDFTDRNTCVLFGDGAGAAVVTLDQVPYACTLGSRGDAAPLWIEGPGPAHPVIHMDGQAVFRFAVEALPRCVRTLLEQSALRGEEIDWFVPHQANARIVSAAARRLGLPLERFYQNMDRYGNTSAASIPIALDEMDRTGLLRTGQTVICAGFGAGLTWGGVLLTL